MLSFKDTFPLETGPVGKMVFNLLVVTRICKDKAFKNRKSTWRRAIMKTQWITLAMILTTSVAIADSPDSSFIKNAAEGGMSEVELGQLAQQKGSNPAVKDFGAMMVKDHTAANEKLKTVAAAKQVALPDSPSLMQKASTKKLDMMSGDSFDKAYVKGMIDDHKADIKEFQKEATDGKDPEVKAFAVATLPTLKMHLQKIQAIAASAGITD
jgi:putative membrane protein